MIRVNRVGTASTVVSNIVSDENGSLFSGVVSVPNAITLGRLLLLPVFLWVLFARNDRATAAFVLGGVGYTDWIDGWVARRFNQTTNFGSVFDPFVDRMLFIVATVGVMVDGAVPRWLCIAILVREIAVGAAMLGATVFGMQRFAVSYWGKWYTLCLMTAVPLLLLGASNNVVAHGANVLGWILAVPGMALSYYTAIAYVPVIRTNLRAGRVARRLR
ncbi:MAG: CDP-alcohol phosphatidyltransferase family protein [Actinobacteria bacterium]|nr:MAG: CDP-alcohol phosphatidyltransferase family protein [Actinomycetota bacterium]